METKTNYFESAPGNKSSSRVIVFIVVIFALLETLAIIYFGRNDIVAAATAAGVLFVTVAGPAMAFMFGQKHTEYKK